MSNQRTIRKPVEVSGRALFSSVPAGVKFLPAPANSGVVFLRTDLPKPARISANIANLAAQQDRRTSLRDSTIGIDTFEHILSAVNGLGLDNLLIELDADEIPNADGSPLKFAQALVEAGIEEQPAERPVALSMGQAMLAALPGEGDCLDILYDLDYSGVESIGRQVLGFRLYHDNYLEQVAPARTFLLEEEAREFQSRPVSR